MSVITKEYLNSLDINLDDQTFQAFSDHFDETLLDRIIDDILDSLDDPQVQELLHLRQTNSDQLWQWLQTNVPDLNSIIQNEVTILIGDVAENSEHI